ncbi:hypothetical protein SAMN05660330_00698 [Desulforhopalus singaporensis]|uniref:Uncharacterized protein n=1 Tax=Desulforhopalus singaporensis TaxID=91360 RepID=A0A1H0L7N3_9BACT|nr:hypothetical protein SAMN05660330_00698 [Desulforhopalus singaporensis]
MSATHAGCRTFAFQHLVTAPVVRATVFVVCIRSRQLGTIKKHVPVISFDVFFPGASTVCVLPCKIFSGECCCSPDKVKSADRYNKYCEKSSRFHMIYPPGYIFFQHFIFSVCCSCNFNNR